MKRVGRGELKVLMAVLLSVFAGMSLCQAAFAEAIGLDDFMTTQSDSAALEYLYEENPTSEAALADFYADNFAGIGESAGAGEESIEPAEFVEAVGEEVDMDAFTQAVEENASVTEETPAEPASAIEGEAHEEAALATETAGEAASAEEATVATEETTVANDVPVEFEAPVVDVSEIAAEVANDIQADDAAAADLGATDACDTTVDENGNTVCVSA